MSTPSSEAQICDALVRILKTASGSGPVYPGYFLPKDMMIDERNVLTFDEQGRMNVCFVERLTVNDLRHGINKSRLVKTTHLYAVWFYFDYFVTRDEQTGSIIPDQSSPRLFQQRVEANRAAFNLPANVNLGLELTITHSGLNVPTQMGLTGDYDNQPHKSVGQIEVTQGYC